MELIYPDTDSDDEDFTCRESAPRIPKIKKIKLEGLDLTAALDRAQVSDRRAAIILAAFARSLKMSLDDICLSAQAIRRKRIADREQIGEAIRINFNVAPSTKFVVHWDGKLMEDPTDKLKRIDRVPVLVSGDGIEQLLGVPGLDKGTGDVQATAVQKLLDEWDVASNVCGMVFDTAPANSGDKLGACVLLETKLQKLLLHLACRHHVYEVVLKKAYKVSFGGTSGPHIQQFNKFKNEWHTLDTADFKSFFDDPGMDPTLIQLIRDNKSEVLQFARKRLKVSYIFFYH